MTTFPSIPGWDGIHPALVHFPIALLFAAPLLILVSLFSRRAWGAWAGAAWVVMAAGVIAAWFAVASGHAAGQLVDKTGDLAAAVARHEALGLMTRNLFTFLALVFAAILLVPVMIRKPLPGAVRIPLHALFLVFYLGGTLVLLQTANQGGRLVHEHGVRAMVGTNAAPLPAKPAGERPGS